MNLNQKFEALAAADPTAPAIIFEGKLLTRRTFQAQVDGLAAGLFAQGIKAGDVVGVGLPNTPLHLMSMLAIARLGAASLPLHPRSAPVARRRLISRYGVRHVLVQVLPARVPPNAGMTFLQVDQVLAAGQAGFADKPLPTQPDPSSLGRISLTSGTTGEPSAVAYTHANWLSRLERTAVGFDPATRLLVGSLHLTLGNILAFAAMLAGGVVVFSPAKGATGSFAETIRLYGVTHASLVPSGIKPLAAEASPEGLAFPSLRQLRIVGGALSEHLHELARTRLTPHVLLPYGTSETGVITVASAQMLQDHPGYCGTALPGVEIQVVDEQDRVLGPGEQGEIRVKVPLMPAGYHLDDARSKQKFKDGWFYTSDLGRLSAQGMLQIEGRSDDRINIAGMKMFPEQVENALDSHPLIKESAVFTLPDPLLGKKLVAALVSESSAQMTREQVLALCQSRKLAEKTPAEYFFCDALPRNPNGKLVRTELPALMEAAGAVHSLRKQG